MKRVTYACWPVAGVLAGASANRTLDAVMQDGHAAVVQGAMHMEPIEPLRTIAILW